MNTKSFQESLEVLNEFMIKLGLEPVSEKEASADLSIVGGESVSELRTLAYDLASEMHTQRCEEKEAWRYQH
jgi:hypothetical protein